MCIPDGLLRASVDGELPDSDRSRVESHVAECGRCRERARELAARAGRVQALFDRLAPDPSAVPPDADAAFERLEARRRGAVEPRRAWWVPRWSPAWGLAAAGLLTAFTVASGPGRAMAQRILGILRVKTVVVVPMERDFVAEGKGKLLAEVVADSVTVTKDEKPQNAATREQASQLAGYTVRLPEWRSDAPRLVVEGEHAFEATVKQERVAMLLNIVGRTDLQLPPGLNGAKVAVDVPRSVRASYGTCPERRLDPGAPRQDFSDCVVVWQAPVPTVVTVPQLDLQAIAQIGLQLTGMSAEQAASFAKTVDWTSTLAIPLPRDAATSENVKVDGVEGVLITGQGHGTTMPPGYGLVWVKNGFIYSIGGFGDGALAAPMAQSMR
jgi:hypothetical protein